MMQRNTKNTSTEKPGERYCGYREKEVTLVTIPLTFVSCKATEYRSTQGTVTEGKLRKVGLWQVH